MSRIGTGRSALLVVLASALIGPAATSSPATAWSQIQTSPGGGLCEPLPPNGDFEAGTLAGFTRHSNTEAQVVSSFGSTPAFGGSYMALLSQNGGTNCEIGGDTDPVPFPEGDFIIIIDTMVLASQVPSGTIECTLTCTNASTGQVIETTSVSMTASAFHALTSPQNGFSYCTSQMQVKLQLCPAEATSVIVSFSVSSDTMDSGELGCLIDEICEIDIPTKFDCIVAPKLESFAPWQNAPCG